MKRSSDAESPVEREREKVKPFRRQNPVSCQFCRNKKLRCDRAQPCSNCLARHIVCNAIYNPTDSLPQACQDASTQSENVMVEECPESFSVTGVSPKYSCGRAFPSYKRTPHSQMGLTIAHNPTEGVLAIELRTVESRLRALEQVVFQKPSGQDQPQSTEALEDGTILKTAKWIEAAAGTPNDTRHSNTLFADHKSPYESILEGPTSTDWTNFKAPFPSGLHDPISYSEIITILPSQATAELLFTHYARNVNWVYHIIHVPTVRQQLTTLYVRLECGQKPSISHLALVATILAVAAYFSSGSSEASSEIEEMKGCCQKLSVLARRALSQADHLVSPSIETIQATIIMTQLLPNYGQNTSFIAVLTHCAHTLQLHQVDSIRNRKLREETGYDAVELEVKRRIWWYIAGTDWLLSFMSGPQCGTYFIHPNQMNVLKPSNLDDDELSPAGGHSHPMSEPTEMSFTTSKIKLAEEMREIVDEACKAGLDVEDMPYDQILSFDRKFNNLLDKLPWFYQLDEQSRRRSELIDKERPYIAWQRIFIHFGIHTRLSRLHRPYLARGYKDPRYAYSRMICLRSARMVIEMEQNMRRLDGGFNPDSGRLWIIVHHVFVATVTLVMDYCCHRDDPQAAERKQEIMNCYKILERSKEDSIIARRGLAHLKQIMRDWRMKSDGQIEKPVLENESARPVAAPKGIVKASVPNVQAADVTSYPETTRDGLQESMAYSHNMDLLGMGVDVAQNLWLDPSDFSNMNSDPQWDILFRDLESQPGIYS